jgi:hypothetical protein
MKNAPYYVVDHARKIIVGQFFQEQSANDVRDLLQDHTASTHDVMILNSGWLNDSIEYYAREYRRADEKMLMAIEAETHLIEPETRARYKCVVPGAVVKGGFGEDLIAVRTLSAGPKFLTWYMVGVKSGKGYKYKVRTLTSGPAFVRMATIDEWAVATGKKKERDARIEKRVTTNQDKINIMDLRKGDRVIVGYSNGSREEEIEDINYKNGRVAIKRRGFYADSFQKRRFIDAKHITRVVAKAA